MKRIGKILIANRGEIAVRIIRTLRKTGIRTVAIYSPDEEGSLHVRQADESFLIQGSKLSETYLNTGKILRVAAIAGVDAIHPGYGFLSENADFAEAVTRGGFIFIGPSPDAIRTMGNKYEARKLAKKLNIPLIKGIEGDISDIFSRSQELNYPVLIKAAAGGGGKAMRIVRHRGELVEALEVTSREALNYFGDERLYAESYYENVRHIETQLLADQYGNVVILGERDCSIQRRHQKVIEESPSLFLKEETRRKLMEASEKIAREIGYTGAGTVEFLVDEEQNFFFLEMNTRIQVEHPVTEMVTGLDIVQLQVDIAAGQTLQIAPKTAETKGHAIEARIYAEDPGKGFLPSPGFILDYKEPRLKGLRIDSSISGPAELHPHYDPMIAKLVVHGSDRSDAITLLSEALRSFVVNGIPTNRELLLQISRDNDFRGNRFSTVWLEQKNEALLETVSKEKQARPLSEILAAWLSVVLAVKPKPAGNLWQQLGYWRQQIRKSVIYNNKQYDIFVDEGPGEGFSFTTDHITNHVCLPGSGVRDGYIELDGQLIRASVTAGKGVEDIIVLDGMEYVLRPLDYLPQTPFFSDRNETGMRGEHIIKSPLHGRISRLHAVLSGRVRKGEVLFTLDAMKIENKVLAPVDGLVKDIVVNEGDQVKINQPVIILDDNEN